MMDILHHILLGLIQGVTEFLPVSSSGHLVIFQMLLGVKKPDLLLEVSLHFGSLVAILLVFHEDIRKLIVDTWRGSVILLRDRNMHTALRTAPLFSTATAIIIGSVPAGLAGFFLYDPIKSFFRSNAAATGLFLALTGLILLANKYSPKGHADNTGPLRGLLIGMAQATALLPGISRSGSTIVTGCYLGLTRREAGRFSFLLALPAMAGATILEISQLADGSAEELSGSRGIALVAGAITSLAVSWICLTLLLKIVKKGKLHWFAAYCLPLGSLLIVLGM